MATKYVEASLLLKDDPTRSLLDQAIEKIPHNLLIVRQKGLEDLRRYISSERGNEGGLKALAEIHLPAWLVSDNWECRQGGFLAAKEVLHLVSDEARLDILRQAHVQLEHPESRVRLAIADLLREMARLQGVQVYEFMREKLLKSIQDNFVRDSRQQAADRQKKLRGEEEKKAEKETKAKAPTGQHDTEGWKSLETSFTALQKIMEGTGPKFAPYLDEQLLGYEACGSIAECLEEKQLQKIASNVVKVLVFGLGDNWSQVRHAASVATRSFLLNGESFREMYYHLLVPPMCLNRYYVAEGVRLYSLQTWKEVFGQEGATLVAKHAKETCAYYIMQANADNHAVREAACHCIAELGAKVDKASVEPFVDDLLQSLIVCFKDESWPVRDAACRACGLFVSSFPEKSRQSLDELFQLWFDHLSDNIPSVRLGSAQALGKVIIGYGASAIKRIKVHVDENLSKVKSQKSDSAKYSSLENVTQFGVAKPKGHAHEHGHQHGHQEDRFVPSAQAMARANDAESHTNQTMYSCGSLAPKLRRAGGCMDHSFRRNPEPWETSDGCVCMIGVFAEHDPELAASYLPKIAELASITSYIHHTSFAETIWKQVPIMAKAMGKKPFKRVLEPLVEPLFYALGCDSRLAQSAAGECLQFIGSLIGPTILRGRLSETQNAQMDASVYVNLRQ